LTNLLDSLHVPIEEAYRPTWPSQGHRYCCGRVLVVSDSAAESARRNSWAFTGNSLLLSPVVIIVAALTLPMWKPAAKRIMWVVIASQKSGGLNPAALSGRRILEIGPRETIGVAFPTKVHCGCMLPEPAWKA
jgi:hypothetical protein